MRRRSFLTILAAAFAASIFGLILARQSVSRWLSDVLVRPLDTSSGTGSLDEATTATLIALGEILVPPGTSPARTSAFFWHHLEERAEEDPGYHRQYVDGAQLLDETAREMHGEAGDFAALSGDERDAVLIEVLGGEGRPSRMELGISYLVPEGRRRNRFRRFVFLDMLRACYAAPLGWSVVGYDTPPGYCSNLEDYTRPGVPIGPKA